MALDELKKESRFADCLIVDFSISLDPDGNATPSEFLEKWLFQTECRILIATDPFTNTEEIVLPYN